MFKPIRHLFTELILLFSLGLLWGSGYVLAKFATTHGASPLGYAFWQSFGPALLLGLIVLFQSKPLSLSLHHCRYYAICGLLGIALPNTNMYFAAAHLPAGILAVIVNTVPIMTLPLALAFRQERFQWLRFCGILVGLSGIGFIVIPHSSLPDPTMLPWALLAFLSPLAFAICAIYINGDRPSNCTPLQLATGMLFTSTIYLLPLVWRQQAFYPLHWPFNLTDKVILLEVLLSSIGYIVFFTLIRLAGPVYYSLVGGVVALTGLMWGQIIFNEHFNAWNFAAVILILAGIVLVSSQQKADTHD